jgi:hydrogenase/urease accessory protein HupE
MTLATSALAHEIRPALLEITEQREGQFHVLWKVPVLANKALSIAPRFPASLSLLGQPTVQHLPGARIERMRFRSDGSPLAGQSIVIDRLSENQIDVLVQVNLADGSSHSAILRPKSPSFEVPEKESYGGVAWSYLQMGAVHILSGVDHLLFVLALMLIVPNYWALFKTITAFTVAHSLSLGLATLGFLQVPSGPTEAVIALSILFLAVEVVHKRRGKVSLTERHTWLVAFTFGLVHGLGFAGALSQVGLPDHAIPLALLMFNIGVECGQILFLSAVLVVVAALRWVPIAWPAGSWRLMPYSIGSAAAFWTMQRVTSFL